MTMIVVDDAAVRLRADVALDADWVEPLPQLFATESTPLNLTGKTIEIYVRPTFGSATDLLTLVSTGVPPGIIVDYPLLGKSQVRVPRLNLITAIPARGGDFEWFARLIQADGVVAPYQITELWRGPFIAHPGNGIV